MRQTIVCSRERGSRDNFPGLVSCNCSIGRNMCARICHLEQFDGPSYEGATQRQKRCLTCACERVLAPDSLRAIETPPMRSTQAETK